MPDPYDLLQQNVSQYKAQTLAPTPQPAPPGGTQIYGDMKSAIDQKPVGLTDYNDLRLGQDGWYWQPKIVPTEPHNKSIPAAVATGTGMGGTDPSLVKALDTYSKTRDTSVGEDIGTLLYNAAGPGFNRGLAQAVGAPVDLATAGINKLTGAFDIAPIKDPVGGSESVAKLMGMLKISTDPDESTQAGYFGSKIGEFLGATLPFASMPLMRAAAYTNPTSIAGQAGTYLGRAPKTLADMNPWTKAAAQSPLKFAIKEADLGVMAGTGAAAGGDIVGRDTPEQEQAGELAGAMLLSPRGPLAILAGKGAATGFNKAAGMIGFKGLGQSGAEASAGRTLAKTATDQAGVVQSINAATDTMVPGNKLTVGALSGDQALMSLEARTIRKNAETHGNYLDSLDQTQQAMKDAVKYHDAPQQAIATVLGNRLVAALEAAKTKIAAMGGTTDTLGAAARNETAARVVKAELADAHDDANISENGVWQNVDRNQSRSYLNTQTLYKKMADEFEKSPLRNKEDFPTYLEPLLNQSGDTKTGLSQLDTLGNGQDLRSRILQDIRVEQSKDAPNKALLGNLGKLQSQLLEDIGGTDLGGGQNIDPALRNALAFSRAKNEVFNSNEVAGVLGSNKRGIDRVGEASTLENFLKTGPKGGDALDLLTRAAQYRYGGDGPGSMTAAAKDVLRQKFVSEAASNGHISPTDAARFQEKYANILLRWPDVAQQVQNATSAEGDVVKLLGANKPMADTARNARAELYLDNSPGVAMEYAFGNSNQYAATKSLVGQLQEDATGEAFKGFKQMVVDKMFADNMKANREMGGELRFNGSPKNGIPAWVKQNEGVIRALDEADPGFAKRVQQVSTTAAAFERQFVNPGVDVTAGLSRLGMFSKLLAQLAGSKFGQAIAGGEGRAGTGSQLVMAHAGSQLAQQLMKTLTKRDTLRVASAALADPVYYKAITQDFAPDAKFEYTPLHAFWLSMGLPGLYGPGSGQTQSPDPATQPAAPGQFAPTGQSQPQRAPAPGPKQRRGSR